MTEPEYLTLFSNTGDIKVKVVFKDSGASIKEQTIKPDEIRKLVSPDGKNFITKMRFDDHLAEIEKIDMLVAKKWVVLHARVC
jgi:hypothetical protein